MRSHNALPSGPGSEDGAPAAVDSILDNVVPLFAPRAGSVAALIAAASGPAEARELAGEAEIRATFRMAMLERPSPAAQRRHRLAPFAIAAGTVAGLVAGTAGLSAAAVLPPAASHVVAQVLQHVGIDVSPSRTVSAGAGAARSTGAAASSRPAKAAPANTAAPATGATTSSHGQQRSHTGGGAACEVSAVSTAPATGAGQLRAGTSTIAALNAALAVQANPAIATPSSCTVNRGTHHAGKTSGKGSAGSGTTGPGSGGGTTVGKGTNHSGGGKGHHHGAGGGHQRGHHGDKGGAGSSTGAGGSGPGTTTTTSTTTPATTPADRSPSSTSTMDAS